MAPTKPSGSKAKSSGGSKSGAAPRRASKGGNPKAAMSKKPGKDPEGISKKKQKSMSLAKPGGAQKTKSNLGPSKKKKRVYTEAELDIPALNSIVPAGVVKPKGQKKGKVFVDDALSIQTIMAMVNAEKEGHIESKIQKARQWEEVREAKKKEQEARSEAKKEKFEERKTELKVRGKKGKMGRKLRDAETIQDMANADVERDVKKRKSGKRVAFG